MAIPNFSNTVFCISLDKSYISFPVAVPKVLCKSILNVLSKAKIIFYKYTVSRL